MNPHLPVFSPCHQGPAQLRGRGTLYRHALAGECGCVGIINRNWPKLGVTAIGAHYEIVFADSRIGKSDLYFVAPVANVSERRPSRTWVPACRADSHTLCVAPAA